MKIDRLGFPHRAAAGLIVLLALIYLPWTWGDDLASLGGDSAVYIGMAREYTPYLPDDPIAHSVGAMSQFPPLYPLALALTGGANDLHLAHLLTTLFLILAFVAHYFWSTEIGLSRSFAIACVLVFAIEPGTYVHAFYLHSESLFILLSLAALTALSRSVHCRSESAMWIASLLIATALLTRTAGLALLPAFGVALGRQRPRRAALLFVAACAPSAAWSMLHNSGGGYHASLAAVYDGSSLRAIAGRIADQLHAFGVGLLENLVQTHGLAWVGVVFIAGSLLVAGRRFIELEPDGWFVAGYLGMMALWPFPAEAMRFAWVLTPLLLTYAIGGAALLGERFAAPFSSTRPVLRWAAPAMLAILLVPGFALALGRRFDPVTARYPGIAQLPEWYGRDAAVSLETARFHLEMTQAFRRLGAEIPVNQCVYSIKPALVAFYAQRVSSVPPSPQIDTAAFEAQLRAGACRYFLLLGITSPSYKDPYYPYDRLEGRLDTVAAPITDSKSGSVLAVLARLKE